MRNLKSTEAAQVGAGNHCVGDAIASAGEKLEESSNAALRAAGSVMVAVGTALHNATTN